MNHHKNKLFPLNVKPKLWHDLEYSYKNIVVHILLLEKIDSYKTNKYRILSNIKKSRKVVSKIETINRFIRRASIKIKFGFVNRAEKIIK